MDVEDHPAQWDEEEEEVEILLDEEEDLKELENLQDVTLLLRVKLRNELLDHNKPTDQINPVLILRPKLIHQLNNQNQIPHHIKAISQNMNLRRKIHLLLNNYPKLLPSLMMMILAKRIRNFLSDSEMIKVLKIRALTIVIQIFVISRDRDQTKALLRNPMSLLERTTLEEEIIIEPGVLVEGERNPTNQLP